MVLPVTFPMIFPVEKDLHHAHADAVDQCGKFVLALMLILRATLQQVLDPFMFPAGQSVRARRSVEARRGGCRWGREARL